MNMRKFSICVVLSLFTFMLFCSICFAERGEITDVKRQVPEQITEGEIAEIKLYITGAKPFMAGIVETIPQGFTFPENDADVSDSEYFKLDRVEGKIAFAVNSNSEITYKVIPSGSDVKGFEGYWVDMLFQSPELNQGENMWFPVADPNTASAAQGSETASGTETAGGMSTGGFNFYIPLVILIILVAAFVGWKKFASGGERR